MQKIVPNFWFDGNAREAVEFYVSAFPNAEITGGAKYPQSKEEGLLDFQEPLAGDDLVVEFSIGGYQLVAINAGPEFKPTPSHSIMVNFDENQDKDARQQIDALWEKLGEGGTALMPLQEYPFSPYFGWMQDKYGYSWQLTLAGPAGEPRPKLVPALMFGGPAQNRAEEAIEYYTSVFPDSSRGTTATWEQDMGPATAGTIMYADFTLANQWFAAMDAGAEQDFTFNEAVSFQVNCKDQEEIDYLWSKLSAVAESEQCGWCKDQFGVSWQIVPENMEELMQAPDAFTTMMNQKKIVIADYK